MTTNTTIPVWDTVSDSWRYLADHWEMAARLAVVPVVLFLAVGRLDAYFDAGGAAGLVWRFIHVAAYAVPAAWLLVPWYRAMLGGTALPTRVPVTVFGRFVLYWIVLESMVLAALLPMMIALSGAEGDVSSPQSRAMGLILVSLIIVPPALYVYGRCCLVFPAASANAPAGLETSWRQTGDNAWRIIGIIILCSAPLIVLLSLMPKFAPDEPTNPLGIIDSAVVAVFSAALELIGATPLALIYRRLAGPDNGGVPGN